MDAERLRTISLFDGLDLDQLTELAGCATEIPVEPGVVLFQEGEHADFWWVLVDGALELVRHVGREDVVVARMDAPGRWAGGFRAWDEQGVYLATGRGAVPGLVLRVPAHELRSRFDQWFPFGGHLISGLYHTARSIESTARQRSSLVTLGTLAAGLAHEINNPASAATRSVDGLAAACATLLASLRWLADNQVTAEQFAALDQLRLEVDPSTVDPDPLSRADLEQDISGWLARNGVQRNWAMARQLAAAGVDVAWCARAAEALPGRGLEAGLEWVASTLSAQALLAEVKESTRRISELVASVRSYSQLDRGSRQPTDVREGIESTLVMLGHKLGTGVQVVRELGPDVPLIDAYTGELNQVWTNLIDNAVDAMEGDGTLRISTRLDGDDVVVEVADSGPGMPPEVVARAFEPFFSTKDVGKGTGLGLDIAHRIVVERHGGTIEVDSRPGNNIMRVRLPREGRPTG